MGSSGRERVNSTYNWPRIISAYEDLWSELAKRRACDEEINPLATGSPFHPSRPDPFDMFASFPSRQFTEEGNIEIIITNWSEALNLISLKVGFVYSESLVEIERIPILFKNLEPGSPVQIKSLIRALPTINSTKLMLTLAWLVKLGICRYYP
jgi:hypothetical protein